MTAFARGELCPAEAGLGRSEVLKPKLFGCAGSCSSAYLFRVWGWDLKSPGVLTNTCVELLLIKERLLYQDVKSYAAFRIQFELSESTVAGIHSNVVSWIGEYTLADILRLG